MVNTEPYYHVEKYASLTKIHFIKENREKKRDFVSDQKDLGNTFPGSHYYLIYLTKWGAAHRSLSLLARFVSGKKCATKLPTHMGLLQFPWSTSAAREILRKALLPKPIQYLKLKNTTMLRNILLVSWWPILPCPPGHLGSYIRLKLKFPGHLEASCTEGMPRVKLGCYKCMNNCGRIHPLRRKPQLKFHVTLSATFQAPLDFYQCIENSGTFWTVRSTVSGSLE